MQERRSRFALRFPGTVRVAEAVEDAEAVADVAVAEDDVEDIVASSEGRNSVGHQAGRCERKMPARAKNEVEEKNG